MRQTLPRFVPGAVVVLVLTVLANLAGTVVAASEHRELTVVAATAAGAGPSVGLPLSGDDGHGGERCIFCDPLPSAGLPPAPELEPVASPRGGAAAATPVSALSGIVPPTPSARAPPGT